MKEASRILLVSDESHNLDEVVSYLKSWGVSLKSPANLETGRRVFKENKPHLLLLSFRTLELAKSYYLSLLGDKELHEIVLHQTILLCPPEEAKKAATLAIESQIDDYFIFDPISDPHRLRLCVHHALNRRVVRTELSESQANLKTVLDFIRKMFNLGTELQAKSAESYARLFQGIAEKLDHFAQKMAGQELSDTVQVINHTKLSQHFHRLKNDEFKPEFKTSGEHLGDLHKRLVDELNEYIEQFQRQIQKDRKSSCSFLIIDRHPGSIKLLKMILESEGHHVNAATDVKHAVVLALKRRPHLILMEALMPEINGIELTRRFKQHPTLKDIPIVIVTTHPSTEVAELSVKVGASNIIAKPVRRQVLLEKIEQVLHGGPSNDISEVTVD